MLLLDSHLCVGLCHVLGSPFAVLQRYLSSVKARGESLLFTGGSILAVQLWCNYFALSTHCWLLFNFWPTRTPFPSVGPQPALLHWLTLDQVAFAFANFMWFPPALCSSLCRSSEWQPCPLVYCPLAPAWCGPQICWEVTDTEYGNREELNLLVYWNETLKKKKCLVLFNWARVHKFPLLPYELCISHPHCFFDLGFPSSSPLI